MYIYMIAKLQTKNRGRRAGSRTRCSSPRTGCSSRVATTGTTNPPFGVEDFQNLNLKLHTLDTSP